MSINLAQHAANVVINPSRATDGIPPDYLVQEIVNNSGPSPIAAYSGKTHRNLASKKVDEPLHWSALFVTKLEITQVLGRLRGFVPKSKIPILAKRKR